MASSRFYFVPLFVLLLAAQGNAQPSDQSTSMGQLFTSPEEREYLDYLREDFLARTASQGFDIQTEEIPDIETPEPEQNVEFHLDAIVTNQDGSHTIWLNGSAIREMNLPREVALVQRSGRDMLQISTSSGSFLLKPGQTVNLSTGELWESFEPRPANTASSGDEASEDAQTGVTQSSQSAEPAMVTSTATQGQPTMPSSPASGQGQGVVAIQDLIEALQMIQSGSNEDTSGTAQQ